MGKEAIAYRTEDLFKQMQEKNMKLLFTTHGFKLLGIVTWDRMLPDEGHGARRRWIKGLVIENGSPLPPEDRVFETSLHRKNQKSGQLEDIVAHEDDLCIVTERKTFELDDDPKNFQFMPNMHLMNHVQQMSDEIEEGRRRIARLKDEHEQALLDVDHFKIDAQSAKEREKTKKEIVNRLTRENNLLQEKVGNLEAVAYSYRAKNLQLEAYMDERTAVAAEEGTVKGMTSDDMLIHAADKKKELHEAMLDIEPAAGAEGAPVDEIDELREQVETMQATLNKLAGGKEPQKTAPA